MRLRSSSVRDELHFNKIKFKNPAFAVDGDSGLGTLVTPPFSFSLLTLPGMLFPPVIFFFFFNFFFFFYYFFNGLPHFLSPSPSCLLTRPARMHSRKGEFGGGGWDPAQQ